MKFKITSMNIYAIIFNNIAICSRSLFQVISAQAYRNQHLHGDRTLLVTCFEMTWNDGIRSFLGFLELPLQMLVLYEHSVILVDTCQWIAMMFPEIKSTSITHGFRQKRRSWDTYKEGWISFIDESCSRSSRAQRLYSIAKSKCARNTVECFEF